MDFKKILKPTKAKLILTAILTLLSSIPHAKLINELWIGFPIPFSTIIGDGIPQYRWIALVINIAIWYMVSVIIVYTYNNPQTLQKTLKPTLSKLILFIILLALSFIPYVRENMIFCSATVSGFPFPFYNSGLSGVECPYPAPTYSWIGLILNIAVWYLVSVAIVYAYNKIKKR